MKRSWLPNGLQTREPNHRASILHVGAWGREEVTEIILVQTSTSKILM